jgi:hypothetical protein
LIQGYLISGPTNPPSGDRLRASHAWRYGGRHNSEELKGALVRKRAEEGSNPGAA